MNILITGGASGLGAAITRKLAANTADVIYFTYCKSVEDAKQINRIFQNTHSMHCDFNNLGEVETLATKMMDMDLDVLVNNAITGMAVDHFHKLPLETFRSGFMNNLLPVIEITQRAILIFRKKKLGKIITILSSANKNRPAIGWSSYLAEKAYLESLSRAWAAENRKFNVTSVCIFPSFMETKLTRNIDKRIVEEIAKKRSTKKLLSPEEVADVINSILLEKGKSGEVYNYQELVLQ